MKYIYLGQYCCQITFRWIPQDLIDDESSLPHYGDVIMSTMASQITSLTIVCSTVYSGADQRKHQSSASLVFVCGIHRWPVNSPHKGPVTQNMFPFDDVIMLASGKGLMTPDSIDPNLCHHMVSLGHKELIILVMPHADFVAKSPRNFISAV